MQHAIFHSVPLATHVITYIYKHSLFGNVRPYLSLHVFSHFELPYATEEEIAK